MKNKYVILRHLGDMCLFTSALRASVNKSHIPSLPQNNLYLLHRRYIYQKTSKRNCPSKTIRSNILMVSSSGSTSAVVTTHSYLSIMPCLPYVHHLKGLRRRSRRHESFLNWCRSLPGLCKGTFTRYDLSCTIRILVY